MLYRLTIEPDPSDCERRDDWFLEQDVNAWTSLGYVAAGVVLAVAVVRGRLPRVVLLLAALAALEGVGSFAYHGSAGDVSQFLHDIPLIATLAFVAGWHVGRLVGRADRGAVIGVAVGVVVGGALWLVDPGVTNVLVGVLVGAVVVAEVLARRRRLAAVWGAGLLVLVAVAVATWFLGSTDGPLCDDGSWAQPHGLWHLLTAVIVVVWADRAYAALDPDHAPRLLRHGVDRSLGLLAKVLVHAFHRSVDVVDRDRFPRDRPVLVVANHGNGFVDPLVVASVLGRLPRFMAKAALWKVVVARPFLSFAGVLPVYRSSDGDRSGDNRSVFEECHRELAAGEVVAIFPEGTTGDRGALDRVRSGAARIALGAVPTAPDLAIVPIGMAFESRVTTRTRTVVMVGEPLAAASYLRHPLVDGEGDPADVAALTADVTSALEAVSPGFASVYEREVLRAAARVERTDATGRPAGFGEAEDVARRLAAAPDAAREAVVDRYRRYATGLELVGIGDDQLRPGPVPLPRLVLSALTLLVVGSLVVTATLIHLPALLLVLVATGLVRSTATKGTVRMLVGLVAGLLTWVVAGVVIADGFRAVLAGAAVAAGGAVALAVWAPLSRTARTLRARLRIRDRAGLLPPVLADREALVTAVRDALGTTGGPP